MNTARPSSGLRFAIILLLAMVLQVMPIFSELALWRPSFVVLILIYFILYQSHRYGIGAAWLVGLLLDVVYGEVLGKYALAFGICAYLLMLLKNRLLHTQLWHQSTLVFLLVLLTQLLVLSVNMLNAKQLSWQMLVFPAFSSMLIWPLLYLLMQRVTR